MYTWDPVYTSRMSDSHDFLLIPYASPVSVQQVCDNSTSPSPEGDMTTPALPDIVSSMCKWGEYLGRSGSSQERVICLYNGRATNQRPPPLCATRAGDRDTCHATPTGGRPSPPPPPPPPDCIPLPLWVGGYEGKVQGVGEEASDRAHSLPNYCASV